MMTSLAHQIAALARRYRLASLYVFGSRANEVAARVHGRRVAVQSPDSDVDIAVQPQRGERLSASQRAQLAADLEELLGTPRVDLVVVAEVSPFLALEIIRGELLYCADPDAQAEEELYLLRRAGDLAPFERERRRMLLGGRGL